MGSLLGARRVPRRSRLRGVSSASPAGRFFARDRADGRGVAIGVVLRVRLCLVRRRHTGLGALGARRLGHLVRDCTGTGLRDPLTRDRRCRRGLLRSADQVQQPRRGLVVELQVVAAEPERGEQERLKSQRTPLERFGGGSPSSSIVCEGVETRGAMATGSRVSATGFVEAGFGAEAATGAGSRGGGEVGTTIASAASRAASALCPSGKSSTSAVETSLSESGSAAATSDTSISRTRAACRSRSSCRSSKR